MAKNKKYTDKSGRVWDSEDESKVNRWLNEWGYVEGTDYVCQGTFIPGRRFRGDFVFKQEKIIVEVMGMDLGGWAGHNNVFTIANDYKRHMQALMHGWKMIYWCKGVTKTDLYDCLTDLISQHHWNEGKDCEDPWYDPE